MNLRGPIKLLAVLQLLLSLAFATAAFATYMTYEGSIGRALRETTRALELMSSSVRRIAASTLAEQETIEATIKALKASRNLIEEVRLAGDEQARLLPLYVADIRNAASIATDAGKVVQDLGGRLVFSVPTSIVWDGLKPSIVYTTPLAAEADSLRMHGKNLQQFGKNLDRTADAVSQHGQGLGRALADVATTSGQLLDQLTNSMSRIKVDELPMIVKDLNIAAGALEEMRAQVATAERFALAVLVAALLLSALFVCNSLVVLLLARRLPAV